jgi:hypothetical protein
VAGRFDNRVYRAARKGRLTTACRDALVKATRRLDPGSLRLFFEDPD